MPSCRMEKHLETKEDIGFHHNATTRFPGEVARKRSVSSSS